MVIKVYITGISAMKEVSGKRWMKRVLRVGVESRRIAISDSTKSIRQPLSIRFGC